MNHEEKTYGTDTLPSVRQRLSLFTRRLPRLTVKSLTQSRGRRLVPPSKKLGMKLFFDE